jgi:predicted O-linked N-acetylglucosamine transferase (SPINDLY family)
MPTVEERLAAAVAGLREGRPEVARRVLEALLGASPGYAPAWHLLGVLACEAGRAAEAAACFARAARADPAAALYPSCVGAALQAAGRAAEAEPWHRRALELSPADPTALTNLAVTLTALGRHGEAEAALRRALASDPADAAAWCNLAGALRAQGREEEALRAADEAVRLRPDLAEAHHNRGNALLALGRRAEAEDAFRRAAGLRPDFAPARGGLGDALLRGGRPGEAAAAYREAARLAPADPGVRVRLGEALLAAGRAAEAVAACQAALRLRLDDAEGHNGLGNAWQALGRLDDAAVCYREAARLRPGWSVPVYNLGVALQGQGRLAEARACYAEALRLDPSDRVAHSTAVGSLLYDPDADGAALLAAHRGWAARHAPPADPAPHANDPDPERRLRVGYVSPDFRSHALAFFLGPVLARHDPGRVEVFCYAGVAAPDETTARLKGLAHHWRDTAGLSDEELAVLVRRDGIDALVDLCGHLAGSRLRSFALRPAPIQMSWLGYPATTGLDVIRYRLTDAVADPPGEPPCHSEQLVRLPGPFCCYGPPEGAPEPRPPQEGGPVVFGALHKLDKLNDQVIALWAELLRDLPAARLLLCRHTLQGGTAGHWRGEFARRGVAPERLELRQVEPVGMGHLRVYDEIDVALDAFPWGGHTTACEALWMGVPVVTLRGRLHAGRMVASVLTALGLQELIARTPEDYRRIAGGLAADAGRRAGLRATLRGRMRASPLCDAAGFTRGLEAAYRALWRAWCTGRDAATAAGEGRR